MPRMFRPHRTLRAAVLGALLGIGATAAAMIGFGTHTASARATVDMPFAILQTLDKITARVSQMDVRVGETAQFASLDITVRACRAAPPEETPESAAFLEIDYTPPREDTRRVFTGWMFASSPAVSAMDHPVFDVWVVACVETPPQPPEDMGFEGDRGSLPRDVALPPARPEIGP